MTDYRKRSYEKELLDKDGLPFDDIRLNMQELNFINSHLGGHHITITGFKNLAAGKETVSVCEIGCGGGDNLDAIYQWSVKNKLQTKFTGVDINPNCIAYAKEKTLIPGSRFIVSDYKTCELDTRNDILFSSLFCHHFHNHELVQMMKWMQHNSKLGFFINDLHRHPVAYYFIKLATQLFSSSYLVKNDAPLSVLRGFKKKEWKKILDQAGITGYNIKWKWAFRHLIVVKNHK